MVARLDRDWQPCPWYPDRTSDDRRTMASSMSIRARLLQPTTLLLSILAVLTAAKGALLIYPDLNLLYPYMYPDSWDWLANGVLGGAYHLSQPWQILGGGIFMWTVFYSLPVKYFRSTWFSIILHGSINVMWSIIILGLILGLV